MGNRQWRLAQRPVGAATARDFELAEAPATDGPLAAGEIEVQAGLFLCAPTMRNWMDPPGNSLYPSVPLGAAMYAPAGGRILRSAHPDWPVGADITWFGSWQERHRLLPDVVQPARVPAGLSLLEAMGRFGLNPLTAYFGLLRIGEPKPGETLLVSGAAGSVGSVAVQIGKLKGCRVVAIAGGAEKCRWLTESCGADAVIDYKAESLGPALEAACPDGIDIFFDNVGGATLDAAVDRMNKFGRIVLCGQIAGYDGHGMRGPANMMRLIYGSVRMQGFLMGDYAAEVPAAIAELRGWMAEGRLAYRDDVRDGFERLPESFLSLFDGSNRGTLLVMVDPAAGQPA
ncbi:MAG: NADP-dependent oxidoreductase [Sandaracinobacter sp.]